MRLLLDIEEYQNTRYTIKNIKLGLSQDFWDLKNGTGRPNFHCT